MGAAAGMFNSFDQSRLGSGVKTEFPKKEIRSYGKRKVCRKQIRRFYERLGTEFRGTDQGTAIADHYLHFPYVSEKH
jgi:hypothetical protein